MDSIIMDAHYSIDLAHAFKVGPNELTKLVELLENYIGKVEIRADCSDKVSRSFSHVRELISYENTKSKEIRAIRLIARSDDFSKRASIELTDSKWRGISLDFTAGDEVVSQLRTKTTDIIDGLRPWYDIMHNHDFVLVLLLAYLLLWFALNVAVVLKFIQVTNSTQSSPRSTAILQLIPVFIFGLGYLINGLRDCFFPQAVFAIGQGASRFDTLEKVQWSILIAFGVSFIASLAFWFVQNIRSWSSAN